MGPGGAFILENCMDNRPTDTRILGHAAYGFTVQNQPRTQLVLTGRGIVATSVTGIHFVSRFYVRNQTPTI
jgi:hypothetical protein